MIGDVSSPGSGRCPSYKISREDILAHAYAQCRSNKGAPGVDDQDFADIEAYGVERWLAELALALREETYRPEPIRRVYIPARLWGRWRGSVWHAAVERGLAPIAAGLILSGGVAVLRVSPGGAAVWTAAVAATVLLLRWSQLHPLALFAIGGALFGLAGLW